MRCNSMFYSSIIALSSASTEITYYIIYIFYIILYIAMY